MEEANAFYRALREFKPAPIVYRHPCRYLTYTEGVKFLVERLGADWLIPRIARLQPFVLRIDGLTFQLWEVVTIERMTVLVCSRNSEEVIFKDWLKDAACPIDYLRLYVEGGVLMLPSER